VANTDGSWLFPMTDQDLTKPSNYYCYPGYYCNHNNDTLLYWNKKSGYL